MIRAYASWLRLVGLSLALLLLAAPSIAETGAITRQPVGATMVPDKFLRRWDPVTIFFDKDTGPAKGGPEDAPQRYAAIAPAQPGAWSWLNAKTLQFRPSTPWPALGRFTVKQGDKSTELIRLLDPTTKTLPANGAQNLERVESLTLHFAEPLETKALAQMLDIALTPLPGLDTSQTRHLTPRDFDIKPVERAKASDEAAYVIELHQPIPNGMRVVASLGLAPEPGLEGTVERIEFTTAAAFRPILVGCNNQRVPLAADGTVYDQTTALACKTEGTQETAQPQSSDDDQDQDQQADADQPGSDMSASSDSADDDSGEESNGTIIDPHPKKPGKVSSKDDPATGAAAVKRSDTAPATPSAKRELVVQFSAVLGAVDPLAARNLVRITPSVEEVESKVVGDQLRLTGKFKTDTLYQIALEPAPLKDKIGRDLVMPGHSIAWLYWPAEPDFLQLVQGNGMVERLGPQMVPVHGRGYEAADVRIHAIDPQDRSFWPFPTQPIATNDDDRPPTTGETVEPWKAPETIRPDEIKDQLARLGSPSVSSLLKLPLTPLGTSARFGLDLAPSLARIAGKDKPGTYLIGVRALDKPGERSWTRIQVTDLSLTVVEADAGIRLFVTSLNDGKPVDKAHIRFDGTTPKGWHQIDAGDTAADGHLDWSGGGKDFTLHRVVVTKGDDTLVIDPQQAPDRYSVAGWYPSPSSWLEWTSNPTGRHPAPRALCHIFTERPIYRPDDPVHIKAYIRLLQDGLLKPTDKDLKAEIVVKGPDDAEWRYPVKPEANGSVHYLFDEKTQATGLYQAVLDLDGHQCALAGFKKDAYRLPRFQVRFEAPRSIPLDKPADIGMTATYYAGGPAGDRPVRWRVTQFPYAFTPKPRDGFTYATDARYQSHTGFDSSAAIEREDTTDGEGRSKLVLDPTRERSAAPRRYVVEATVTGDDDKTVTNTQDVLALPPFVLALKAPRYLEQAK